MPQLRVARSAQDVRSWSPKNAVVTLGVFDGVHIGHKRIVTDLVENKTSGQADECYLITFDPHPLVVTHSKMTPPMLTTLDERIHLLEQFDLNGIFVLQFDEELANLDYRSFINKYLLQTFNMKRLILGYDCYFGKNREGSPERVKEESVRLGFDCNIVPAVRNDDEAISSTRIRNALIEGDLTRANRLLGHPYLICGDVVRGHGKGEEIGFPTANLAIADPRKQWPPGGVYAVEVQLEGEPLRGMMNIGRAPTIKSIGAREQEIEVHLFDFEDDIYGKTLWVSCHTFLRQERRFPSVEALVAQLERDRLQALESLGGAPQKG